ncbi:MAG: SUMF1/EgtB/PvdO family nonheme iron enzyme [Steroidobacteraceae bacterium]
MTTGARPAMRELTDLTIIEPQGQRRMRLPLTIGGAGATIVVPGPTGPMLNIEVIDGRLRLVKLAGAPAVDVNGDRLDDHHDLAPGDVVHCGRVQLRLQEADGTLALDVEHDVANRTQAPGQLPATTRVVTHSEESIAIKPIAVQLPVGTTLPRRRSAAPPTQRLRWVLAAVSAAALATTLFIAALIRVPLDLAPNDLNVRATGSLFSWHAGDTLFVFAGRHQLRARREGYYDGEVAIVASDGMTAPVRIRLVRKPGLVTVDTADIAALAYVDGAEAGKVPGELEIKPGAHTITLRAKRYLDAIGKIDVEGGGLRQTIAIEMQPDWGVVNVSSSSAAALLRVDDQPAQALPARLELPAGVHRLRITASDARAWDSSVVVQAGRTMDLGPIDLGAPDALLEVRSQPSAAEVSVGGKYRGRTPLTVSLAPGVDYPVLVSRRGYRSRAVQFTAVAGKTEQLKVALEALNVSLNIAGEPAAADVFINGVVRGRAPLRVDLPAGDYQLELRAEGFEPLTQKVALLPGVARQVDYQLFRPGARREALARTIRAPTGAALQLITGGQFNMGSARREQGRRPNESLRAVTLKRPFYIGVTEVSNGEFRRFRPDHKSGIVGDLSIDLDSQAVTGVDWAEAVEYCNWLSREAGLAEAYERRSDHWVLRTPVGDGYRLPTEAEWEYAARVSPGGLLRYAWGNSLPVPSGRDNLGGSEAGGILGSALAGHSDEYKAVAPTGRFPANPSGLFDMGGNVSEWVNDRYAAFPDREASIDPLGPESGRSHVFRGASWRTTLTAELRLAWREAGDVAANNLGFRIARYADPAGVQYTEEDSNALASR